MRRWLVQRYLESRMEEMLCIFSVIFLCNKIISIPPPSNFMCSYVLLNVYMKIYLNCHDYSYGQVDHYEV